MNLETIKKQFAQEHGYEDWRELQEYHSRNPRGIESHMDEICIRAQKAALENIKKNVSEFIESDLTINDIFIDDYVNIVRAITNPENLIR